MADELWKKAIEICMVRLESDLSFGDISSRLIADDAIRLSPDKCQDIMKAKSSRRSQTERLLDLLDRKTSRHYDKFMETLKRDYHNNYLYDQIQKYGHNRDNDNSEQPTWRTALQRGRMILVENLDVNDIKNMLRQERVLDAEEEARILSEPDPNTRSEKVRLFLDHLCRRQQGDFEAFLVCLGRPCDFLKTMLVKEIRQLEQQGNPERKPYWKEALTTKREELVNSLDLRDFSDCMLAKRVITIDQLEECTAPGKLTRRNQVRGFVEYLKTRTKREFDAFLKILVATNYGHLKAVLEDAMNEVTQEARRREEVPAPTQESDTQNSFHYAEGMDGFEDGQTMAGSHTQQPMSDRYAQESMVGRFAQQPIGRSDHQQMAGRYAQEYHGCVDSLRDTHISQPEDQEDYPNIGPGAWVM